jgi:polyisoprenoid-binding protein YceI
VTRRKRVALGVAAGVLAVLAAGAILAVLVFGGDPPPPAALSSITPSSGPTTAGGGPRPDLDGTWTIDASSGSLADGTSSFAGYRIRETVAGHGADTVVGRTQGVTGSMTVDGTTIAALDVTVDMTSVRSDQSRRDEVLRDDGLQTDRFPTATFSLTEPIHVATVPPPGQVVEVTAVGELTLPGETNAVEVPIQARRTGDTIEAVAQIEVSLADYGIVPPTGVLVLSIADTGTIELHLLFVRA